MTMTVAVPYGETMDMETLRTLESQVTKMSRKDTEDPKEKQRCERCYEPHGGTYYRLTLTRWTGDVDPPLLSYKVLCTACTFKLDTAIAKVMKDGR